MLLLNRSSCFAALTSLLVITSPALCQDYSEDGENNSADSDDGRKGRGMGGKRPSWYVSSEILEPIITGTFTGNDLNLNVGYNIGKMGSLQMGFSLRDTKVEGSGKDRQSSDPDDQQPDDNENQSSNQYKSIDFGYFHNFSMRKTGLRLGALLTFGNSETKAQDLTTVYSQDNSRDFTQTLSSSKSRSSFYAMSLRLEVEHNFTRFLSCGIMQDFVYQVGQVSTEQMSRSRAYSNGVLTGIDDPTKTDNDSDQTDIRTFFRGIYLRVYF